MITAEIIGKWDNAFERIVFAITEAVVLALMSLSFFYSTGLYLNVILFSIIVFAFGIEFIYECYKYIRWLNNSCSKKVAD